MFDLNKITKNALQNDVYSNTIITPLLVTGG